MLLHEAVLVDKLSVHMYNFGVSYIVQNGYNIMGLIQGQYQKTEAIRYLHHFTTTFSVFSYRVKLIGMYRSGHKHKPSLHAHAECYACDE